MPFSWGCVVHYLACTAQPGGSQEWQGFTFTRVGWWNTVQVRMLHRQFWALIHR